MLKLGLGLGLGTAIVGHDPVVSGVLAAGAQPASFSGAGYMKDPLTILGSAAWFVRADTGVSQATGVSQWNDLSGNTRHFTQGTGAQQPTFISSGVNGRPTVRGNGTSHRIGNTFSRVAPGTQPFYLWFLLAQVGWTLNRQIYNDGAAVLHQTATTPRLRINNNANSTENAAATIGAFKFVECYFSNSTSDYLRIGATNVTGVNAGNLAGTGTVFLFGNSGGTTCSNVEIAEAGCFLGTPTGTGGLAGGGQRAELAQYMSDLYGASVLT